MSKQTNQRQKNQKSAALALWYQICKPDLGLFFFVWDIQVPLKLIGIQYRLISHRIFLSYFLFGNINIPAFRCCYHCSLRAWVPPWAFTSLCAQRDDLDTVDM